MFCLPLFKNWRFRGRYNRLKPVVYIRECELLIMTQKEEALIQHKIAFTHVDEDFLEKNNVVIYASVRTWPVYSVFVRPRDEDFIGKNFKRIFPMKVVDPQPVIQLPIADHTDCKTEYPIDSECSV